MWEMETRVAGCRCHLDASWYLSPSRRRTCVPSVHFIFMVCVCRDGDRVEYHATMESCSDKFHVDIPNVV
jgi:hypothetical protein